MGNMQKYVPDGIDSPHDLNSSYHIDYENFYMKNYGLARIERIGRICKIKMQMRNSPLFLCFCVFMEIAICLPAYAPMKAGPSHQSEQVSQLLCGEPVLLLENVGEWSLVETEHQYRAYVRTAHLMPVNLQKLESYHGFYASGLRAANSLLASIPAFHWEEPGMKFSGPSQLEANGLSFGHQIAEAAKQFLNVPYVWGGKTPFGLDCSGLVQLVLNLAGFSFPRDAWQQAEIGEELVFEKSRPEPEEGDLLFFRRAENRIHHVGISLGGSQFIHASEWVRIESLSPAHPDFAEDRFQTLCLIKKIRPAQLQTLRESIIAMASS
jgi:hypothetical protein